MHFLEILFLGLLSFSTLSLAESSSGSNGRITADDLSDSYLEMTKEELTGAFCQKLKVFESLENSMPIKLHKILNHERLMLLQAKTLQFLNWEIDIAGLQGRTDQLYHVCEFASEVLAISIGDRPEDHDAAKECLLMNIDLIQYIIDFLEKFGQEIYGEEETYETLREFRRYKKNYTTSRLLISKASKSIL